MESNLASFTPFLMLLFLAQPAWHAEARAQRYIKEMREIRRI